MMDMDINAALNIAKQLKNHYRAFERIDELLKKGVAIQTFMKEGLVQKANMEQEIVTLTQERDETSKALISMRKEKISQIEAKTKELLEEYSNRSDKINKEIKALETKKEEAKVEIEKAEKEHVEKMEAMEKERENAQRRLEEIKGEIAQIRERLE